MIDFNWKTNFFNVFTLIKLTECVILDSRNKQASLKMNLEKQRNKVIKSLEELRELHCQSTTKAQRVIIERMIENYQRISIDLIQLMKVEKRIKNQAE